MSELVMGKGNGGLVRTQAARPFSLGLIRDKASYSICLVPVLIMLAYWHERPFQSTLSETHNRITDLSRKQKSNIALACKKLDGYVIRPGETFSFNHVVGPRTHERGFVSAPTYVGNDTIATEGGGICFVSSLVYKVALQAGLRVVERTPHSRTISTIQPGLDATVWYGRYDLKVKNTSKEPLRISANMEPNAVTMSLQGPRNWRGAEIIRNEKAATPSQVAVTVRLRRGDKVETVSTDLYDR